MDVPGLNFKASVPHTHDGLGCVCHGRMPQSQEQVPFCY